MVNMQKKYLYFILKLRFGAKKIEDRIFEHSWKKQIRIFFMVENKNYIMAKKESNIKRTFRNIFKVDFLLKKKQDAYNEEKFVKKFTGIKNGM